MCQRLKLTRPKILLLGADGVGKTAFAVRYVTKRFIGEYDVSKETLYSHRTTVDKEDITVDILDLSSDEEAVLVRHARWADGVVLLYSVTDRQSFTKVDFYHAVVQYYRRHQAEGERACAEGVPIVVVGNKTDLSGRRVSAEEAERLCKRLECQSFELSVAAGPDGVCEVVDSLLQDVRRELHKSTASLGRRLPFANVKRVFKRKVYRSRSDTLR